MPSLRPLSTGAVIRAKECSRDCLACFYGQCGASSQTLQGMSGNLGAIAEYKAREREWRGRMEEFEVVTQASAAFVACTSRNM